MFWQANFNKKKYINVQYLYGELTTSGNSAFFYSCDLLVNVFVKSDMLTGVIKMLISK